MFFGTRFYYKILYFITALTPAYILFSLQIYSYFFEGKIKYNFFGYNVDIVLLAIVFLILILIILGYLLKKLIIQQYKNPKTDRVLEKDKYKYKSGRVKVKNGSVVSFLLGNIIPSVIIIENNLISSLFCFVLLHFLIYKLIINSTDVFPNVLLILYKIDLCKTENNDYLFVFYEGKSKESEIYIIGNPNKSKLYITKRRRDEK